MATQNNGDIATIFTRGKKSIMHTNSRLDQLSISATNTKI